MATAVHSPALAAQARRFYFELIQRELAGVVKSVINDTRNLMTQVGSPELLSKRRDLVLDLPRLATAWHQGMLQALRTAAASPNGSHPSSRSGMATRPSELALVEDGTIELEIIASRLALTMMDKASWEFSDLRYRMSALERREEMEPQDVLRPHVLARAVVDGWRAAGLSLDHWRTAQQILHEEFAALVHEGFHETNRWLISHNVCADVNLRPFIRRGRDSTAPAAAAAPGAPAAGTRATAAPTPAPAAAPGTAPVAKAPAHGPSPRYPTPSGLTREQLQPTPQNAHQFAPTEVAHLPATAVGAGRTPFPRPSLAAAGDDGTPTTLSSASGSLGARADVHDETRMMTRSPALLRTLERAEVVLGKLNRMVSRQVPEFNRSTVADAHSASPGLRSAINDAERAVRRRFDAAAGSAPRTGAATGSGATSRGPEGGAVNTPALLQELQARKQLLKEAATTPVERATIEIVALMFQAVLTEERIPATVRVWFARLQMPVLRVAIVEPDFFATIDHPARKLIDRMGACVMGFEAGSTAGVSEPMEREIKRVVQVVEAYPDTGRRVFQTVLTEYERFLDHYFKTTHAAASRGVSLAQQIEQRETLAIQYTIELRKMLNQVPVHDGVREFLFQIWADVLATTAVKTAPGSETTKQMQKAASELIWLASAKVSREERSEAIRRLPPLLKRLREGMGSANVPMERQNEYIQALNNSLQAAFSARTATIPNERLDELMIQLETLEDMLPDAEGLEIDESMVRDLSGEGNSDLEVVAEGGSMPSPAMVAWARDLQVGAWFKLDYAERNEAVQLAWQGMHRQFSVFVTPQGRGIMFQNHRLAAFLQAGLMVPAEEEALTVRATRDALAKLDADPTRLLH